MKCVHNPGYRFRGPVIIQMASVMPASVIVDHRLLSDFESLLYKRNKVCSDIRVHINDRASFSICLDSAPRIVIKRLITTMRLDEFPEELVII